MLPESDETFGNILIQDKHIKSLHNHVNLYLIDTQIITFGHKKKQKNKKNQW